MVQNCPKERRATPGTRTPEVRHSLGLVLIRTNFLESYHSTGHGRGLSNKSRWYRGPENVFPDLVWDPESISVVSDFARTTLAFTTTTILSLLALSCENHAEKALDKLWSVQEWSFCLSIQVSLCSTPRRTRRSGSTDCLLGNWPSWNTCLLALALSSSLRLWRRLINSHLFNLWRLTDISRRNPMRG